MSSSNAGNSGNGGILRSSSTAAAKKKRPARDAMEVTFGGAAATQTLHRPTRPSPSDQEYDEMGRNGRNSGASRNGNGNSNSNSTGGEGYDSDDLYDASMAAGGALPSAMSSGGSNSKADATADGLPHDRAEIDAARRQRRKRAADAELADRAEEIERIEDEEDDIHAGGSGSSNNKMGPAGGDNDDNHPSGKKGQFRGEEDLDAGLSLISSTAATSTANPTDPSAISGAYDAGTNAVCPVEPFNLRAEREGGEGYFDGDTYVFRRLEDGGRAIDEEPDAWLDELGGRDADNNDGVGGSTGGAAAGGVARLAGAKGTTKKQPALDLDDVPHEELCRRIASLLAADRETVARGLKRYGDVIARDRKRRQKLAKKQQRSKKAGAGAESDERNDGKMEKTDDNDAGVAAAQKALADLTDLADALLMGGDGEVYSRTREELLRMAAASGGSAGGDEQHVAGHKRKRNYFGGDGDANDDDGNDGSSKMAKINNDGATGAPGVQAQIKTPVQWEYRGNQDQQIHGPYTTEQMLGWIQAGYFVGEAAVDVRRVASADSGSEAKDATEKATADDLMADLMDSDDDDGGDDGKEETTIEWERSDKVDFKSYLR